jgi:hypothetical protein
MAIVNNFQTTAPDADPVPRTFVVQGLDPDLYYQDRVSIDADRTVPNRCGQIFPQNTPLFDV